MSSEVSVKMTADDAALWQALQRTIGASQKTGEAIEGAGKKGRAATAEMDRLAKRLMEINSTPAERYERNVERMRQTIGRAGFTQEHFNRAVEREKQAFDKATAAAAAQSPELAKASEEQRRFIERTKELNATPLERYEQNVARLKDSIDGVNFTQDDFNRAVEREKQVLDKATAAAAAQSPELAKAAAEMDRFVASVKQLSSTPLQEHEEYVRKLDGALAATEITQEEYATAVAKSKEQLTAATLATDKHAQANLKLEAELDRVSAKIKETYQKPWDRFAKEIDKIDEAFARGKISAEEHAAATKDEVAALEKATLAADRTAQAEEKAAKEMDDFVASVKKLQTKPIDEYEKTVRKLRAAQEAGKLTQQEYARGVQEASAKYGAARQEISRSTTATQGFQISTGQVLNLTQRLSVVALAWKAIGTAIESANAAAEKNSQLAIESKESQKTVAVAQAETLQNLTGLSTAQKTDVLTAKIPAIQSATGFPDLAKLTQAVGAGYSASGDITATLAAVRTAAEETALMPDKITTVAAGLLDLSRGTGIKDTDALQGFLLQAGAINRIEDPAKLASSLAPLVASGVARLPKQNAPEAAREIGALFGVLAGEGTDREGRATETAANTLLGKMESWFKSQNAAVTAAETKKRKGKSLDDSDKSALTVGRVEAPTTLKGQIEFFQKNAAARSDLLGTEGFGEQKFRTAIEQVLVDGSRVAEQFAKNIPTLSFDASTHRQVVNEQRTATPQLRLAMEAATAKTGREQQAQGLGRGIQGFAMDDVQDALVKAVPRGMFDSALASFENTLGPWVAGLAGTIDPAEAINVQRNRIDMRVNAILRDQFAEPELQTIRARGPLTSERVNELPLPPSIKSDLQRLTSAREGLDRLIKSGNATVLAPPVAVPRPEATPEQLAAAQELFPDLASTRPEKTIPPATETIKSPPVVAPAAAGARRPPPAPVSSAAAARQRLTEQLRPTVLPAGIKPIEPAPVSSADATRQRLTEQLRPSPRPNDLGLRAPPPFVSPETRQPDQASVGTSRDTNVAALDQAGRRLLDAADALATAAERMSRPAPTQVASVPRRVATGYPDYSSGARREQAVAAG